MKRARRMKAKHKPLFSHFFSFHFRCLLSYCTSSRFYHSYLIVTSGLFCIHVFDVFPVFVSTVHCLCLYVDSSVLSSSRSFSLVQLRLYQCSFLIRCSLVFGFFFFLFQRIVQLRLYQCSFLIRCSLVFGFFFFLFGSRASSDALPL